jgi:hypothetical protein
MDELKRRLEVLLGAKPEAPVRETERAQAEQAAQRGADHKQRVAEAGGQLVAAAFRLLGELLPPANDAPAANPLGAFLRDQLAGAVEADAAGRPVLTLTLPDQAALDSIAQLLGGLLTRAPAVAGALN